jgi:hypothetical protein
MSEPTITYRYRCNTEGIAVYETRNVSDGVPTVCKNDGGAITVGSLTIIDQPVVVDDLRITETVDFMDATISNFSHTQLQDIGTHTHAQIDSHINDATIHRSINDSGSSNTDLWSASKIATQLATKSNVGHTHTVSDITDYTSSTQTIADARISAQKGQNNGLATLDGTGKIPLAQVPLNGSVIYQGTWNATTNSPALSSGSGTQGFYYRVSVAGATALDGITDWQVGDWAIYNGAAWEKVDNTDQVTSVAGKQGDVTLDHNDITDFFSAVSDNTDVIAAVNHIANTSNPHGTTLDQVTVATTKGDLLAFNGSNHTRLPVGANKTILQADSSATNGFKWVSDKKFIVSSKNILKTTSTSWTMVDNFMFPGSSIASGNVYRILVNAQGESGVTFKIRIYNVSVLQEIASITGQTNTVPQIIDLGSLSNIPSTDAMFEVHVARTAGSDPNGILYQSTLLEYQ